VFFILKLIKMSTKTHDFIKLFERFIKDMKSGIRLQANGKKIKSSTIQNYQSTLKYIKAFVITSTFDLRIDSIKPQQGPAWIKAKKYWHRFYILFTNFLYHKGCYDNFVGSQVKAIKVFLKYVEVEQGIYTGSFYKKFYVLKEEVDIQVLMPQQLQQLIYDQNLSNKLRPQLQLVKDIFVVGATVALRYGDLMALQWTDLVQHKGGAYLTCTSEKTDSRTMVKIPQYVSDIINKYKKGRRKAIFPSISLDNFDTLIKKLFELAGWEDEVPVVIKPAAPLKVYRFCDLATSHMMRRTAITTMLMHGVQETVVKQISGHAKNSASFYRYVAFVQPFMDAEVEKHHTKMQDILI
jgi:integrase